MAIREVNFDGGGQSTVTSTTDAAGVWMRVSGNPGNITFDIEMVVTGDAVFGSGRPAVFRTSNGQQFQNQIDSQVTNLINNIQNQLPPQLSLFSIVTGITPLDDLNNRFNDITSIDGLEIQNGSPSNVPPGVTFEDSVSSQPVSQVNLRSDLDSVVDERPGISGIGGLDPGTTQPGTFISYTINWQFPTITIPSINSDIFSNLPDADDIISDIPPLQLQHGLPSTGGPFGFGGNEEVFTQVNLSQEIFIETKTANISCNSIVRTADIFGRLEDIRARAIRARENAEEALSNLESLRSDIQNETQFFDGVPDRQEIQSRLSSGLFDQSALNEWENRIDEIRPGDVTPGSETLTDLQSNAQDIRDSVPSPCIDQLDIDDLFDTLDQVNQIRENAIELKQRIADALQVSIDQLGCFQRPEFSSIASDIQSLEQQFRQFSSGGNLSRDNLLSQRRDLRQRVQNQIDDQQCVDQFLSRLNQFPDLTQQAREGAEQAIDCAQELSSDLQNDVNSFISNAREFSRLREIERTEDRFNELVDQGESLRGRINNSSAPQECTEPLMSRLESTISRLENAGPRRESVIPCGMRHSNIEEQVEGFENDVLALDAPVEPETIQEISNQGQNLIQTIEANVDPGRCRQDFISRVRGATGRLQGLQEQVRVTVVEDSRAEEAQQSLDQLIDVIQGVEVRSTRRSNGSSRDTIL